MQKTDQSAGALLYTDKIVIETVNKEGNGSYYITDNVTILTLDCSDKEIGMIIKKHLQESIECRIKPEERKKIRINYRKILKAKTEKSLYENVKCVRIKFDGNEISLNSYKTKSQEKVFLGNPPSITVFSAAIEDDELGKKIRLAWEKCESI